ncbi:hypothetical protein G6O67_008542 [Ophiocordyceps sinensis]|uniref:Uncharacterized protein n=1 Tax=Ophiocordyceps sinensis TaxID=72228 RepID=A0A8H4PJT9_9HYPO|nr:hypothetical protein G6O67_008542 [Ophiocordyceps sinensis]
MSLARRRLHFWQSQLANCGHYPRKPQPPVMSSMFKKKGFAFKPKTPTARPKPVNAPSVPAPKIVESQPSIDPPA